MKIGIDIRPLGHRRTGIGRYLMKVLEHLALADQENRYILFYNMMKGRLPDDLPGNANFQTVSIRLPNKLLNVAWALTSFPELTRFTGPLDIFHTANVQLPPVKNAATIMTIMDLIFIIHPEMAIPSAVRHFKPRIRHYLKRADHILTISRASANDIVEHLGVPESKIAVIYPGTTPITKATETEISRTKAKFNINGNYILFVSCIEPRKNIIRLLQAFDLSGLGQDFDLVLAGPMGWHTADIMAAWNSHPCKNRIRWIDYVDDADLSALYSGAMFLAYPSILEGFGLPILEAMSVGCPVLTSNVSAMPEVTGDAALLVDPYDVDSMAHGLGCLASDSALRRNLAAKGIARQAAFTWEKCASEILALYHRAAG